MAQSQVSAPSLGRPGEAPHWDPGGAGAPPIDIWSPFPQIPVAQPSISVTPTPVRTDVSEVLAEWRAAEKRLDEHIEASPMRSLIQSEIARLRAEYQRLFALKVR